MTNPELTAAVERAAKALTQMPQFDELPSEVFRIQAAEIILRELSLESLLADKARLAEIRSAIEKIVVVKGEDSGLILLSDESPTKWSGELKVNVYQHEHFSPLGDALVALYRMTDTDSAMSEKKGEQG